MLFRSIKDWGGLMKKYMYRYASKYKNIVGITLGIIGFIIVISVVPIEFLLSLIGISLLIMGFLLIKIK